MTGLQGQRLPQIAKKLHLLNCLSIIRASNLELQPPDGAMLTALGSYIQHLLKLVKLGELIIPRMQPGLLGMTSAQSLKMEKILASIAYGLQTLIACQAPPASHSIVVIISPRYKLAIAPASNRSKELNPQTHM